MAWLVVLRSGGPHLPDDGLLMGRVGLGWSFTS
jgi:hypothetical protein